MKKILTPVDGSDASNRAVQHFVSMLRGGDVPEVHLLNVQPVVMSGEVHAHQSLDEAERNHRRTGEEALLSARAILDAGTVRYHTAVMLGDAADRIAHYAEENRVDGIFMGTRGMGPLRNIVLGSVANKVIQLAAVPVTLVK